MASAQGAQDAVSLLGHARSVVDAVRSYDMTLAGIGDRLAEAGYLVSDVAAELAAYAESVDADPAQAGRGAGAPARW